jgi:hypothetical protein
MPAVRPLALRLGLVQHGDLRPGRTGGEERWHVDLAEVGGEAHVVVDVDVLVAEEQHQMVEQRPADRRHRRVVERIAQVEAADLRPDRRRERLHRQLRGHCHDVPLEIRADRPREM